MPTPSVLISTAAPAANESDAGKLVTRLRLMSLLAAIVIAILPVVLDPGAVTRAAGPDAHMPGGAYAALPDGILVSYVWVALVGFSACILVLAPGLIASIAIGRAAGVGAWLLSGFALSLILVSVAAALVQSFSAHPLVEYRFIALLLALTGLAAVWTWERARRTALPWPFADSSETVLLAWVVGGSLMLFVVLLPKFMWENFNGDGAHALESVRLLLHQSVPFWKPGAESVGTWPGTNTILFAYPASWFVRLFGPVEPSARMPLVIYVALLPAATAMIVKHAGRKLSSMDNALVWLSITAFTIGMAYSTTYSPYAADIALSLPQDVLVVVCLLGVIAWSEAGSRGWTVLFGVLATLTAPNGLLLLMLWSVSLLVVRSRSGRAPELERSIRWTVLAIVAGIALAVAVPLLMRATGLPQPGGVHGPLEMLRRFAYLQATDWRRFLFWIVPSGILPVLSLVLWSRLDRISRALALTASAYFLIFYFQAYVSLHYFVPSMLLPLVVFWRSVMPRGGVAIWKWRAAYATAGAIALLLSLPPVWSVDNSARAVGWTIDNKLPGYERSDPALFGRIDLLAALFPFDWNERVPDHAFGGSPLVWNYYSFNKPANVAPNYVIQQETELPPAGATLVRRRKGAAVYVRDTALWRSHLSIRPPTPAGSPLYVVPRWVMFHSARPENGYTVLSVADVIRRLGPDTDKIPDFSKD